MNFIRRHWKVSLLGALAVLCIVIWLAVYAHQSHDFVTVSFLNVGEGDATLIQGKNGEQVLIDAGAGREVLTELTHTLPFFDRSLDMVIETYPDQDNGGGLPYVLDQYKVGAYLNSGTSAHSAIDDEIARVTKDKDIPVRSLTSGTKIDLRDSSYIRVLSPDASVSNMTNSEASLVLQYVYGDTCFLVMGDAPEKTEENIVSKYGSSLKCQVLKIGHHGSKGSTGDELLGAVEPTYAILSNSANNRYSYPDQEVLDRLASSSVKVLKILDLGTITMTSDGKSIVVK